MDSKAQRKTKVADALRTKGTKPRVTRKGDRGAVNDDFMFEKYISEVYPDDI